MTVRSDSAVGQYALKPRRTIVNIEKRFLLMMLVTAVAAFSDTAAQAGPAPFTAYGQTHCIDGPGDGSTWDWELRPEGGGTPHCSGTESFSGTEADFAEHFRAAIDGCSVDIRAYPTATLGFSCPVGMTDFTVARAPDTTKLGTRNRGQHEPAEPESRNSGRPGVPQPQ